MAEIIAVGNDADSADVSVSGTQGIIGLFVATGDIPKNAYAEVYLLTPGAEVLLGRIYANGLNSVVVAGGTDVQYRVKRPAQVDSVGVHALT